MGSRARICLPARHTHACAAARPVQERFSSNLPLSLAVDGTLELENLAERMKRRCAYLRQLDADRQLREWRQRYERRVRLQQQQQQLQQREAAEAAAAAAMP